MGDWGPGPFQNDHAMDLLSFETERWREALTVLDDEETQWDDVQGLLGYVALLGFAAKEAGAFGLLVDKSKPESSREVAKRWKARFLQIEDKIKEEPDFEMSDGFKARRRAVTKTFDALIRALDEDDAPPPQEPKQRAKKATKR
ncbi:MAG: hypothetical protein KC492_17085 [Myxococcales bacterium]|nr:hypothetical protein [Myxococcales bacterium]MCB9607289.1 hypothetical protein [Polyangiaceae bacterium]